MPFQITPRAPSATSSLTAHDRGIPRHRVVFVPLDIASADTSPSYLPRAACARARLESGPISRICNGASGRPENKTGAIRPRATFAINQAWGEMRKQFLSAGSARAKINHGTRTMAARFNYFTRSTDRGKSRED